MIDDKVKEIENKVLRKYFRIQRKEIYSELKSKLIYHNLIIQIRFFLIISQILKIIIEL